MKNLRLDCSLGYVGHTVTFKIHSMCEDLRDKGELTSHVRSAARPQLYPESIYLRGHATNRDNEAVSLGVEDPEQYMHNCIEWLRGLALSHPWPEQSGTAEFIVENGRIKIYA